jgi:hypothetical protein
MALLCKRTHVTRGTNLSTYHTHCSLSFFSDVATTPSSPSLRPSLSQQDGGAHVGFLTSDYKFEIKDLSSASYTLEVSQTVTRACAAVITLARRARQQPGSQPFRMCACVSRVYRLAHLQRSRVYRLAHLQRSNVRLSGVSSGPLAMLERATFPHSDRCVRASLGCIVWPTCNARTCDVSAQ